MKEEIVKEIMEECNDWKERLLLKMFSNMFVKTYHIARINSINYMLK